MIISFFLIMGLLSTIGCCRKGECEEDENDYRDKYVGPYNFTTHDFVEGGIYPNPWTVCLDTTIYFTGTIEKYGKDRLKITFKPDAKEPDWDPNGYISFPIPIDGLIYPVVDDEGILSYPEYRCDKGKFEGFFSNNEVSIKYGQYAGHGGHEEHTIQGIKTNKK